MESYINGYCLFKKQTTCFRIFGYSSRGVPGVELVGFKTHGRLIKEKIVYISKLKKMKIPPQRFVLCLERPETRKLEEDDYYNMELPTAMLFWALSGNLKICNLEKIYLAGKLTSKGNFILSELGEKYLRELKLKNPDAIFFTEKDGNPGFINFYQFVEQSNLS